MGDRFGPYELLEPLAGGGMARVSRARMTGALGFEKIVAIKFMLPGFAADPLAVKMFVDEGRLAATLTHPNIVGILDFGERDGEYYIAMEYVSGANVRVLVKRAAETGRLPPPALAAHVVSEAARGLEYAHAKTDADGRLLNIVHRDVSPQNIVVSWEGEVKVLDFGIARSRQRSFETAVGTIKGKFAYMSPEQALGQGVDHRSDLFSLGAVLYELLTGEKAFPQPGIGAMEKVRRAEFVPPENIRAGLPPALIAIVRRALQRDPDQRYRNAAEMLEDLQLYLEEERSRGGPPVDAGSLAAWAGGLFEVSDSDISLDEPAPDLPPPIAEPGLLPGWGDSEPESSGFAPPPRRPSPTVRPSMTFTGSDEVEVEEESATRITATTPAGWVLPPLSAEPVTAPAVAAAPPPEAPPSAAPPSAAETVPSPLPPPPEITAGTPPVRPSQPAPRPTRDRISRTSGPSFVPRNAPATTPPAELPRRLDARSTLILFLGGLTGAALVTTIFHLATGTGAPVPTPTPEPTAIPSPVVSEPIPDETPIAVVDTAGGIVDLSNPLAVRPGENPIGLLSISSKPSRAQVFLDGRPIAESPALIPNVPVARRYVVEVRLDGHSPWSREVDVTDDQAVQVVAKLVPIDVPGKLRVMVPRGGTAFVDGRLVGKGPANVTVETYPGKHQLRFKDPNGMVLREYEVLVAKGRTTEIELPPP